jgi:cytoskeletal protein CcmA (bactofilin family)
MFGSKKQGVVIPKELKIVGNATTTTDCLVWVYGQIDGKLSGTSLVIDKGAHVSGTLEGERVLVNGKVEGSIHGREIVLKSEAQVVGYLYCQSLAIESGAVFDGRMQVGGQGAINLERQSVREVENRESLSRRIERALAVEGKWVCEKALLEAHSQPQS